MISAGYVGQLLKVSEKQIAKSIHLLQTRWRATVTKPRGISEQTLSMPGLDAIRAARGKTGTDLKLDK